MVLFLFNTLLSWLGERSTSFYNHLLIICSFRDFWRRERLNLLWDLNKYLAILSIMSKFMVLSIQETRTRLLNIFKFGTEKNSTLLMAVNRITFRRAPCNSMTITKYIMHWYSSCIRSRGAANRVFHLTL